MIMIGASAGFTLRYVGFAGKLAGRYVRAALLADVISVTPAMWPNCRSNGVAIDDAIISALAPGRLAPTEIVGKSTCGSGDTGSTLNAIAPAIAIAVVKSVVATGR